MNEVMTGTIPDQAALAAAAAEVAAVEARGSRHETPCGAGHMVWRRWGDGPPLMLVHGGAGAWSHWIRNIEVLSARHTVWAPDLPGLGESAMPEPLSIETIAATVEQGLRALVPADQPVSIVGFSFGASTATIVASRLAQRLSNFVLISCRLALSPTRPNPHTVSWKSIEDPAGRLAAHRRNLEIMMIADPAKIDALAVYLQSTNAPRARFLGPRLKPVSVEKVHEYLPRVRASGRITAISGREDAGAKSLLPYQEAALLSVHPDASFHIVDNAGHWVQYEAADRVNAILLDALAP